MKIKTARPCFAEFRNLQLCIGTVQSYSLVLKRSTARETINFMKKDFLHASRAKNKSLKNIEHETNSTLSMKKNETFFLIALVFLGSLFFAKQTVYSSPRKVWLLTQGCRTPADRR